MASLFIQTLQNKYVCRIRIVCRVERRGEQIEEKREREEVEVEVEVEGERCGVNTEERKRTRCVIREERKRNDVEKRVTGKTISRRTLEILRNIKGKEKEREREQ